MKRSLLMIFLLVSLVLLASIDSMSGKLPQDSQVALIVENLRANYAVSKESVLMDMVLNQLAIEQLIAQYVEMLAYNNGLDPKDVYMAFDGDLGVAVWLDSTGQERLVAILGPMKNPRNVKSAVERLLPQLLPMDMKLNMATDQEYLYIGDLGEYSTAEKGFDSLSLKSDLPVGFGYFYSFLEESLVKASVRNEDQKIVIEGLSIPLSDESRVAYEQVLSGADVSGLEANKQLPLLSVFGVLKDLGTVGSVASDQIELLPVNLNDLGLEAINIEDLEEYLTGEFVVSADLSIDDIFSSLLGSQSSGSQSSPFDITYLVRIGYTGTLDIVRSSIEKSGGSVKPDSDDRLLIVDGQYIWIDGDWLFLSSRDREATTAIIGNGILLNESKTYTELSTLVPGKSFLKLFLDSGYILGGLMGITIESGILMSAEYSLETGGIKGTLVVK